MPSTKLIPKTTRRSFLTSCIGATGLTLANKTSSHASFLPAFSSTAIGKSVVATVHPLASQAAMDAFKRGGNAIDAAIAASLMLSVVDGHNSGLGGGGFALIRTANGERHAIDGREMAPALASPAMFMKQGKIIPRLSRVGPLAAGVPGLPMLLNELCQKLGKLSWDKAVEDAAQVARDGFEVSPVYARRLASAADELRAYEESTRILFNKDRPWKAGEQLVQTDLAGTLDRLGEEGVESFYQGSFAQSLDKLMQSSGGIMRASDLENYHCIARKPIESRYRNQTILGFPPPSSGGIHIAQMLGMLTTQPINRLAAEDPSQFFHLLAEVMKLAMADRAYWLGDADFTKVPRGLIDPAYLAERASHINLEHVVKIESHGQPPRADIDLFGKGGHTTHLTTADSEGNVVALTQTVNTTFGNKMIVPGTGVVLNNELDDFSLAPGVRNAFGLLGSNANLIAPGKRPLSSMSPTLVLDADGQPTMTAGAAGGPRIITSVLQTLVRMIDLGFTASEAIGAPRIHHQWSPDETFIEAAAPNLICARLTQMGHRLSKRNALATASAIRFDGQNKEAAADPRVSGTALSS